MKLICPECKNDINLALYPHLGVENVIECDVCGITLMVKSIANSSVEVEVVDEGK